MLISTTLPNPIYDSTFIFTNNYEKVVQQGDKQILKAQTIYIIIIRIFAHMLAVLINSSFKLTSTQRLHFFLLHLIKTSAIHELPNRCWCKCLHKATNKATDAIFWNQTNLSPVNYKLRVTSTCLDEYIMLILLCFFIYNDIYKI